MTDSWERHKKIANKSRKRRTSNERELVLAHYGAECVCCETTEDIAVFPISNQPKYEWLAERGKGWSQAGFNHQLVTEGFPEGYETRCMRCHRFMRGGNGCACGGKRTITESEDSEG